MSSNLIVTDFQELAVPSNIVTLYDIEIYQDNFIHLANEYHTPSTSTKIQFRHQDTGTIQTYNVVPIKLEGIEKTSNGPLPRPTLTIANVLKTQDATSLAGSIYLGNNNEAIAYEGLLGLRVYRRNTMKKYLVGESGDATPPVEFPIEMFYIDRITEETKEYVTFELMSPFDLEGITLPRRKVVANICSWEYQGAGEHRWFSEKRGGCTWHQESTFYVDGTEHTVYVNKDDEYIVPDSISFTVDPGSGTRTKDSFYYTSGTATQVESNGAYTASVSVTNRWQAIRNTTDTPSDTSADWARVWIYDAYAANVDVDVFTDDKYNTYVTNTETETVKGSSVSVTRLWKAAYRTQDANSHVTSPEFGKWWERGDQCSKSLIGCSMRFGYVPITPATPANGPEQTQDETVIKPFGGFPTSRGYDR